MVRKDQLATIHALKRLLGLDDEAYRDMLFDNFGVRSANDLGNSIRADECIRAMRARAGGTPYGQGRKKYEHLGRRPGMATPAQLRMMEAMWAEVSTQKTAQDREKALDSFVRARFGLLSRFAVEMKDVQKVVKALKEMIRAKTEGSLQVCKHCGTVEPYPSKLQPRLRVWLETDLCPACSPQRTEAA